MTWSNSERVYGVEGNSFPIMQTRLLLSALLATLAAAEARAQSARMVDQGSFTITVSGQRTGRVDFRMAGTPGVTGSEFVARATVFFGD